MSTQPSFNARFLGEMVFSGTQNNQAKADQPAFEGALAALDTFYYGFNEHDLEVLRQNWLDAPLAQLNNPVGGIMRGTTAIIDVYRRIFAGAARVRVEFYDVMAYISSEMVVFAGRERGTYERDGNVYPLDIRTTRIFAYIPEQGKWRQVHHHGSIDGAERLAHYVQTVLAS